jgi:anti-sigma factor RsiW
MNCADIEIAICEYVDGTLAPERKAEVERHLAQYPACAEMARDAAAAVAFMERAEAVEPPPELITRILFEGPWNAGKAKPSAWRKWSAVALTPIFQPRFAMGMAMTILSLAMLWRTVGPAPLRARDLRPARIWATLEDRGVYAWGRTVKFYENLKFVYQIQSTLHQWQEQQEEEQRPATVQEGPGADTDGRKLPVTSPTGSRSSGETQ